MRYFLGVDGGGTSARMRVVDETGRTLGHGEAGIGNLHHCDEAGVREHLGAALAAALKPANLAPADIAAAFFGMAGVTCPSTAERYLQLGRNLGLVNARIAVDHDIRIALAGGLSGRPGIALIVGTGSSCYGRQADGTHWQTGGWGPLIADEGSGYDLGRRSIIAAARMSDGREEPTVLRECVFRWLGLTQISEILNRLYEQGIERHEVAAFAPRVVELAEQGDPAAGAILDAGAAALAELVAVNHRRLPTSDRPEVVITGGLGASARSYRDRIIGAIRARVPDARVQESELSPVEGAALLARVGLGCSE